MIPTMETLTIQVKNNKTSKQKLSEKYAKKLSSGTTQILKSYTAESRSELER